MSLTWKTDWQPSDNHARQGTADAVRLLDNYNALKDLLNAEYGMNVNFTTPATDGYATYPFDGFLNNIEACINALHVWLVEWEEKVVNWVAAGKGPTFEDINRWERNGYAIERAAQNIRSAWRHSGTFNSGMEGLRV